MGGCSGKSSGGSPVAGDEVEQALGGATPPTRVNMLSFLTVAVASSFEQKQKYVWKKKDEITLTDGTQLPLHLLLGITNEGQMKFLERIDFIRWTHEEDGINIFHKYTARAACDPGGWVYNEKYDRSKYQKAIGWVDERWGRVEKHERYGLTGVTGYGESTKHTHLLNLLFLFPFRY